jgi:hypothetical protein
MQSILGLMPRPGLLSPVPARLLPRHARRVGARDGAVKELLLASPVHANICPLWPCRSTVRQVDDGATKHLHDRSQAVAMTPFGREALEQGRARVLSRGRWANAVLYLVEHGGQAWVVKDFASRALFVRQSIGRVLISRELSALRRVRSIAGVPQEAFRVDAYALGYRYVPGRTLNHVHLGSRAAEFFAALEHLLRQVHALGGIVHLDLRSSRNVLVTEHDEPVLIDFQSHLSTRWMPAAIRKWIERFDMAGVYKHWARRSPETMGESREMQLREMNRWRRSWILRGYLGVRRSRSTR